MQVYERFQQFSREQKTGFVLLLFFAILVVVLGVIQLRNTIYAPFVIHIDKDENTLAALFENEETKLQQLDTDHDGLNDYEELNFYSTSPYLADTDSDGVNDKDELAVQSDPTCPQGQKCVSEEEAPESQTSFGTGVFGSSTLFDGMAPEPSGEPSFDTLTDEQMQALLRNPQALRQLILSTGRITKEQLDSIPDATLIQQAELFLEATPDTSRGGSPN